MNSTSHFRAMGLETQKNLLISPNVEEHQSWSWFRTKVLGFQAFSFMSSHVFTFVVHFEMLHPWIMVMLLLLICFVSALPLSFELEI